MKRFDIITEADARTLDIGATVELTAGGHVTPLARDTLASRRVTVIRAGSSDGTLPPDLAPVADIRRVVIGCDHTGLAIKRALVTHLRGRGLAVLDAGTDGTTPVDYPDIAGAGIGSAIAPNTVPGVRAAMVHNETLARYSREHNGANVIALGSSLIDGPDAAIRLVDTWIGTPMREARYIRRLLKIRQLEQRFARD
jgi:ribose 5-phosphate isomerase B